MLAAVEGEEMERDPPVLATFRENWQYDKRIVDGSREKGYRDNPCIHTAPPSPLAALQLAKEESEM